MLHHYYDCCEDSPFFGAFRSQGYLSDAVIPWANRDAIQMEALPPLLRTLLVTDGTVTKSLEAYFWEPVKVDTIRLTTVKTDSAVNWLDVGQGENVLLREVHLRGEASGRIYASAFSIVRLSALPDDIRSSLESGKIGIGVLIRDSGIESYREILDIGGSCRQMMTQQEDAVPPYPDVDLVSRTYRIIVDHKPVILITESFPLVHFQETKNVTY